MEWETVRAELEPVWLDGLDGDQREEGGRLLDAVVADWAREADGQPDPETVLRFQREDLEGRAQGRDAAGRLDALRTRVLGRRADRLSVEALTLARAARDGTVPEEEARERGEALLGEIRTLGAQARGLQPGPWAEALQRELSEATMDALYAVERKAMSLRLAGEAQGAPDVRP